MNRGPAGVTPLPVAMVMVAGVAASLGSVVAVRAFAVVGPAGIAGLRCLFGAVILLTITRPSLRGHTGREWLAVVSFGLSIAVMYTFYNESINLMPIGPALTIEMLGPLVLSVILAKRASAWLWAGLALLGVLLIRGLSSGDGVWHPLGVAFAACAGVAWAGYILLTRATGTMFKSVEALALAQAVAAVLTLPRAVVVEGMGTLLRLDALAWGLAVAVLSNAICNGLEFMALRRLPAHIFSVMMAFGPVFGSLLAWLLINQRLGLPTWLGIGLVVLSSAGATLGERRRAARLMQ